jgi:PPM family protein phosphatase
MANKKLKNFEYANQTVKGQIPLMNTDKLSFFECDNGYVFLIADGEGSDDQGENAAELAIERIKYYLENEFVDKPSEAVYNALVYANGFIYEQSRKNPHQDNRGVSVSCVLIRGNSVFYSSIGHSRIYFFDGRRVYLLSKGDKTVTIEPESYTDPEIPDEIQIRLLGKAKRIFPGVNTEALMPVNGDMVLLVSDGFYNSLNDKALQKTLSDQMPSQTKIYRLMDLANLDSGEDNISAQLISFYNIENEVRQFTPLKEKTQVKINLPSRLPDFSAISGLVKDYLKQPLYKTILGALAFLVFSYMFYDIFLYNPMPARKINNEKITTSDLQENIESGTTDEVTSREPVDSRIPADVIYVVRTGDTWSRIYSEYGVCSWFIRNHPPNAGKFDSADNPIAGQRLSIPVVYSSRSNLNPNFYQEFTLQKTGSRCENANEEFLKNFRENKL